MNINTLDPIGMCMLKQLVETDDARKLSFKEELRALSPSWPADISCVRWEHEVRKQEWFIEAFQFVTHMIFLDVDDDPELKAYRRLWEDSLCLPRESRNHAKFQKAVIAIAEHAIARYRDWHAAMENAHA